MARRSVSASRVAGGDLRAAPARWVAELARRTAHPLARDGQTAGKAVAVDAGLVRAAHDAPAGVDGGDAARAASLARGARVAVLARVRLTPAAEAEQARGAVRVALTLRGARISGVGRAGVTGAGGVGAGRVHAGIAQGDRRSAGITAHERSGEEQQARGRSHGDLRASERSSCESPRTLRLR